ncbi:MAG: hypothetical protein FWD60_06195 [Candidatus Azobacteroides sp.]|nr:hypothetical protein [Candidatus Azobacteroides sp.]
MAETTKYNILKEKTIPNQWNRRYKIYVNDNEIISIINTHNMNVNISVFGLTNLRFKQ